MWHDAKFEAAKWKRIAGARIIGVIDIGLNPVFTAIFCLMNSHGVRPCPYTKIGKRPSIIGIKNAKMSSTKR